MSRNVEMEKDLNLNVMMEIYETEMVATNIVKHKKDGHV